MYTCFPSNWKIIPKSISFEYIRVRMRTMLKAEYAYDKVSSDDKVNSNLTPTNSDSSLSDEFYVISDEIEKEKVN